jgi:hypothetical protein
MQSPANKQFIVTVKSNLYNKAQKHRFNPVESCGVLSVGGGGCTGGLATHA